MTRKILSSHRLFCVWQFYGANTPHSQVLFVVVFTHRLKFDQSCRYAIYHQANVREMDTNTAVIYSDAANWGQSRTCFVGISLIGMDKPINGASIGLCKSFRYRTPLSFANWCAFDGKCSLWGLSFWFKHGNTLVLICVYIYFSQICI